MSSHISLIKPSIDTYQRYIITPLNQEVISKKDIADSCQRNDKIMNNDQNKNLSNQVILQNHESSRSWLASKDDKCHFGINLPSLAQANSKSYSINQLSPRNEENFLLNSSNKCLLLPAQHKKRRIRVQSKKSFPSDFFNDQNNLLPQLSDLHKKISSKESINNNQIIPNLKSNGSDLSKQLNSSYSEEKEQQSDIEPIKKKNLEIIFEEQNKLFEQKLDQCPNKFLQINSGSRKNISRPFLSAIGNRSTQSISSLNQILKQFQVNKNNFESSVKCLTDDFTEINNKLLIQNQKNLFFSKKTKRFSAKQLSNPSYDNINNDKQQNGLINPTTTLQIKKIKESPILLTIPNSPRNFFNKYSQKEKDKVAQNQQNVTPITSKQQIQFKSQQKIKQASKYNTIQRIFNIDEKATSKMPDTTKKQGSIRCKGGIEEKNSKFFGKENKKNEKLENQDINKQLQKRNSISQNNYQERNQNELLNLQMSLSEFNKQIKNRLLLKQEIQVNKQQIEASPIKKINFDFAVNNYQNKQLQKQLNEDKNKELEGEQNEHDSSIKNLYFECCKNQITSSISPIQKFQDFSQGHNNQMSFQLDEIFSEICLSQKISHQLQQRNSFLSNSISNQNEQDQNQFGFNNDYCKETANFNNNHQLKKLKQFNQCDQSSKVTPNIVLNIKQSEKCKPFLIRNVISQCNTRTKVNQNNNPDKSFSSNYSKNFNFDLDKNGSNSTTNGKSMVSTQLASNEYINFHEFSFCK